MERLDKQKIDEIVDEIKITRFDDKRNKILEKHLKNEFRFKLKNAKKEDVNNIIDEMRDNIDSYKPIKKEKNDMLTLTGSTLDTIMELIMNSLNFNYMLTDFRKRERKKYYDYIKETLYGKKLAKESVQRFISELSLKYEQSKIIPGVQVGIISAQTLGSRNLQDQLDSKHTIGVVSGLEDVGVGSFDDLFKMTKKRNNPSMQITYYKRMLPRELIKKTYDLRESFMSDILLSYKIISEADYLEIQEELWYKIFKTIVNPNLPDPKESIMRLYLNLTEMYFRKITIKDVVDVIKKLEKRVNIVYNLSQGIIDIHINDINITSGNVLESVNPNKVIKYYLINYLYKLISISYIKGIKGLKEVFTISKKFVEFIKSVRYNKELNSTILDYNEELVNRLGVSSDIMINYLKTKIKGDYEYIPRINGIQIKGLVINSMKLINILGEPDKVKLKDLSAIKIKSNMLMIDLDIEELKKREIKYDEVYYSITINNIVKNRSLNINQDESEIYISLGKLNKNDISKLEYQINNIDVIDNLSQMSLKYWYLTTKGINMEDVLDLDDINKETLTCNNMYTMYEYYGIEAVRVFLYEEFKKTINKGVDPRHIMLISDLLTSTGYPTAGTLKGLLRRREDKIKGAGFEESFNNLVKASLTQKDINIEGITAKILTGNIQKTSNVIMENKDNDFSFNIERKLITNNNYRKKKNKTIKRRKNKLYSREGNF